MTFESLGLSKPVLQGVAAAGYENPTDIQTKAIPIFLDGGNLVALGETGSGKTAAFGLPLLERLQGGEPGLRALILVPTRELCVQVAENLRVYAEFSGLHVRTAFGGIDISIQEAAFRRGLDVLVACPGRLIDHLQCGNVELDRVQALVLDEADRMLDMGFMPQIRRILARLPQKRQNGMFSATMPTEIERLVKDFFGSFERVQVGQRSQAAATITHRFHELKATEKERFLEKVLRGREGTVLVFVAKKVGAERLGRQLQRAGLPADSIHGDKGAEQRHVVLKAFSRGKTRIMVATDVAARGIDVSDIGLVVNFDMPRQMEDYIHRVGRTGRAGNEGEALSLITRLDARMMRQLIEHMTKTSKGKIRVVVNGKQVAGERPEKAKGKDSEGRRGDRTDRSGRSERGARDRDEERGQKRRRAPRDEEPRQERAPKQRGERSSRSERIARGAVGLSSAARRSDAGGGDEFGFGAGLEGAGSGRGSGNGHGESSSGGKRGRSRSSSRKRR